MPFEWDNVKRNWLFEQPISYSSEKIVEAFNRVEKRFGSKFFDDYEWIRGTYIVTLILDLSTILEEIEREHCILPQDGEIIRKIERNKIYLADTIIRLAAYYLRRNFSVEFEPELLIKGRKKDRRIKPDLRVKFKEKWIYIEESRLDISSHQKNLMNMLDHISKITETCTVSLNIEVSMLKDDLSDEEVNEIIGNIRTLSTVPDQPQEMIIKDLAQIYTYRIGQKKPYIQEIRPALAISALSVGRGVECHLNVQIPFTDERIEKIIKKAKQLSPVESNIIMLDISQVLANLKKWSELIKRRLQPDEHRRICAILLVRKSLTIKSLKVTFNLIQHPNPRKPLSEEFIKLTNNYIHSQEWIYRKEREIPSS